MTQRPQREAEPDDGHIANRLYVTATVASSGSRALEPDPPPVDAAATLPLMSVTLKLLHLWGAPQAWTFDGEDEAALVGMLSDLDEFRADGRFKSAVLFAEREGKIVGAWTRDGIRRLATTIVQSPPSPQWLEVRHVLEDAASGP
jgi:hypothetical protein